MDVQVVAITSGSDLILFIAEIIHNYYSFDLHHGYETTIIYNLHPNYTTLVLYNMLEHPRYYLGMVVLAGS